MSDEVRAAERRREVMESAAAHHDDLRRRVYAALGVCDTCRTVLANSIPLIARWTAARLRSRVPHRHFLRPPQRHSVGDAAERTRVRIGEDALASPVVHAFERR